VQIGLLTNWSRVSAGAVHTVSIKTNGTLWAWGSGTGGALGNSSTLSRSSPVQVGTFTDWSDVVAGRSYTIAVRSSGTIWSWGIGTNGVNGRGNTSSASSPVQIGTLTNWKNIYTTKIGQFVVATKTDGTLWTWGWNNRGQLGLGDRTSRSSPVQVGTLTGWVSGSCGEFSSLFLTS
jgi:alpha-tubulin suppressor-like RCC1 family protein